MKKLTITLLFILPFLVMGQQRHSLALATFNSIEVNYDLNIHYSQSLEHNVDVEGPEEVKQSLQIEIDKKGVLRFILNDKKVSLNGINVFIKSPELLNVTLGKSSVLTLDTDIEAPKAKVSFTLNDNAVLNTKKINAKQLDILLKDNSVLRGNALAKSMSIDARNKSNLTFSGEISGATKLSSKDNAQVNIEKLKGKSITASAAGSSSMNISFKGKSGSAVSSGTASILLPGSIGKVSLDAKDNSSIDIRKLSSKNIKTTTQKAGHIIR